MKKPLSIQKIAKQKGYSEPHIRRLLRNDKLKGYSGEKIGRKWIIYENHAEQHNAEVQDESRKVIFTDRLKEHWDKLAELAGIISDTWSDPDHYKSNLDSKGEFIFSDEDNEKINWMLSQCLVSHLKVEFEEFRNVKRIKDLLSANLIEENPEALTKLELVRNRKTFKGKCQICKFY